MKEDAKLAAIALEPSSGGGPDGADVTAGGQFEAEYSLEHPVRCHACGETLTTLKAIRLLRTEVNFTSTLPRRGRVIVCPQCHVLLPAELTSL